MLHESLTKDKEIKIASCFEFFKIMVSFHPKHPITVYIVYECSFCRKNPLEMTLAEITGYIEKLT